MKCYRANDTPWLPSDRICDIKEDSQGKVWLGTSYGFSMLTAEGNICRFDLLDVMGLNLHNLVAQDIEEGIDGEMWIATENMGIVRVVGNGNNVKDYKIYSYSPEMIS